MAMLVGLIAAIPICVLIYLGVSRLEQGARRSGEMRQTLQGISEMMNQVGLEPDSEAPPEPVAVFPFERSIANQADQRLDVIVTGRGGSDLFFLSLRDNRHYRYPIAGLSEADRQFSETLPLHAPELVAYPVTRQLADAAGRQLVAVIEGRTQFDVRFRVLRDGSRHTYPIGRLSPSDRAFVFGLPVTEAHPTGLHPAPERGRLETGELEPAPALQTHPPKLNERHE
jgi:hypothetical protein